MGLDECSKYPLTKKGRLRLEISKMENSNNKSSSLGIIKTITSILHEDILEHFPISDICNIFGADAGTFWISSELESDDFVLHTHHNRPDLEGKEHNITFSFGQTFISSELNDPSKPFFLSTNNQIREQKWENKSLQQFTISKYQSVLFSALYSTDGEIQGIMNLYFIKFTPYVPITKELILLFGQILKALNRQHKRVIAERRKTGHEIARLLSGCIAHLNEFWRLLPETSRGATVIQKKYQDLDKSLRSALHANSNETFIEGVLKRMHRTGYVHFRSQFNTSSRIAMKRRSVSVMPLVLKSGELFIRMHRSDLDLLISNIFSNADKYSTASGYISSSLSKSNFNEATFIVSNTATRIEPGAHEKVWRFGYRGTNAADMPGEGIGLSVVKDICDVYGIGREFSQRTVNGVLLTDVIFEFPSAICRWKALAEDDDHGRDLS